MQRGGCENLKLHHSVQSLLFLLLLFVFSAIVAFWCGIMVTPNVLQYICRFVRISERMGSKATVKKIHHNEAGKMFSFLMFLFSLLVLCQCLFFFS